MCFNSDYKGVSFDDNYAGYAPDPGLRIGESVVTPDQVQAAYASGNTDAAGRLRNKQLFQEWRAQIHNQAAPTPPPAATGTFGLQLTPPSTGMMQLRTGRS